MDIAIVTGAETPLGLSLIQRLVHQGYRVHGIGNNFSKVTFADPQFFAHPVDLSNLTAVTEMMTKILADEKSLDLLIHAIDVTPGAAFEKLPVGNLEAILKIGLLGPVMLTRLALPNLLRFRGQLINVIPANKSGSPASAVNALLEGGLREMNRALFDGARDAGLRVTNLILRQNPEPDALTVQSSEQTHIDLEDVARAVEHLLDPNFANVPAELVLHPRTSAHSDQVLPEVSLPLDPYHEIVLPPQAYCPPEQPKIPTQAKEKVERTIPYTDDEMEDKIAAAIEDFEAHPERYDASPKQERRSRPERKAKQKHERATRPDVAQQAQAENQSESDSEHEQQREAQESGSNKRRRGRRRGGRNRNRDRDSNVSESQSNVSDSAGGDVQQGSAGASKASERVDVPQAARHDSSDSSRNDSDDAQGKASSRSGDVERDAQQRSHSNSQLADKPKRTPRRGRSRLESKPLLDARIETESEFLSKPDPRPQRRGRTRPESKAKSSVAAQAAPAPVLAPIPVAASEPTAPTPVETNKLVPDVPKKKAVKKTVAKKAVAKAEAPVGSVEGASAVKQASPKKAATKKAATKKAATKKAATKKAAKKVSRKPVKKSATKKAAAKKSVTKKATKKAAKKKAVKKVSSAVE
ncbi:SDR family NAD(P)-dependent oxidoreductase [Coraliomargarita sp. SDUM461004]|uniref:SDR family NAD(P)-dependent oxidoreductase n=1 Tax=Thalassobacterium sedimentorum TaxID=3041258 RepID=A0ABU1AI67_9BACT|nr:SDR family oxidoreductase [Coraliomargarita sp. SDUM461004]MDQ8194473.1 SDR family NAD(P)-dependent oxidoreductase [Coraliomargarita sp. SDUM461004]